MIGAINIRIKIGNTYEIVRVSDKVKVTTEENIEIGTVKSIGWNFIGEFIILNENINHQIYTRDIVSIEILN